MSQQPELILSDAELIAVTGYRRAHEQLRALHERGFWLARRSPTGGVLLDRAHYEAVCSGAVQAVHYQPTRRKPQLRLA